MRLRDLLTPLVLGTFACVGAAAQTAPVCTAGTSTTISGKVLAPNGVDPLPNITVYIPSQDPGAMPSGVQCPAPGAPPAGVPLVGTITATDGTFTLSGVPVSTAVPLVVVAGKWRRETTVDTSQAACANTAVDPNLTRMPRNQSEGDIPHIAIATGNADQVECVLLKVGLDKAEFTDPSGSGRINFYQATGSPGARADAATPSASLLTGDLTTLSNYDVLMLPCEGSNNTKGAADLANLVSYANEGGRVYASHYSFDWFYRNPPFNQVVAWSGNSTTVSPDPGTATVNQSFASGATLAAWLQLTGASTTLGQISISTLRRDFTTVNSPTQSWLTLNNALYNNPTMQFTFDTPVGATNGQCGRVLFNEYHVENPGSSPANVIFPNECPNTAMTPQEKLLEYSLFDLTNSGGAATMTPASADFGSEAVGFTTGSQTFTWKNNAVFALSVSSETASGDFVVTGSNCSSVPSYGTCSINVAFKPTASGARTGTLTVNSSTNTLTAALTGTGIPTLTLSSLNLSFGKVDVGATSTQTVSIMNNATGPVVFPALSTTGDYSVNTNCAALVPANSACQLSITFKPTATGARTGTLSATSSDPEYAAVTSSFTGTGVDFSVAMSPASGSIIAGRQITSTFTATPIAGFGNNITLTCSSPAAGTNCIVNPTSLNLSSAASVTLTVGTTSEYTVIGYGGYGQAALALLALAASGLLCFARKRMPAAARASLVVLLLLAGTTLTTGCGSKTPAKNATYTGPGTYNVTVTATDGFLVHSSTFALTVTSK